ncbi:hypothetical protein AJ79_07474 [Helicocarpus griseus UAMH5409]|uniref:Uncharacterized protein n=1 Tax=Helicocarpus griseus UAMH5409 TaxID=1447875 RepID=A0A2B7X2N4_9EURO|nr:hypothetical protein AJ79_07474 [Helicocarpus griseus UAMH5409]
MSDSRAQTGVRSLLARFENNNNNNNSSTSPPSRGRSPIDSDRPGSVRPLSKVRANFVAVERTGSPGGAPMWGLRKSTELDNSNNIHSNNNSPGKLTRTTSGGVDEVGSPMERSVTMSSNDSADKGGMMGKSLASSPDENNKNNNGVPAGGNVNRPWAAKLPSRQMDSPTPGKQSTSSDTLTTATSAIEEKLESDRKDSSQGDSQAKEETPMTATRVNGKPTEKGSPKKTTASTKPPSRPSNVAVGKKASTPAPRTPRTPTNITSQSNAKTTSQDASTKETDRSRATSKQPSRTAAAKPTAKPQPSAPARDKTTKPASNNPPRNSRSRTRSPTRPIRLPNSMVAPTASSAAKSNDSRPSSQAGTHAPKVARKPATTRPDPKTSTSRATAPTTSAMRKQPSRTTLAPQQNTAHDRPRSRVSNVGNTRPADESFLARMMRPTASSASKAHDRVEVKSPPRSSGPPKPRRRSGESASSHVSTSTSSPPSKKIAMAAQVPSNVNAESQKEPKPDVTKAQVEPEVVVQEPEPKPAQEPKSVPEPEPTVAEPAPEPEAEPEPVVSKPAVSQPATTEPAAAEAAVAEPSTTEPTVDEPAVEAVSASLPDIAEVSIVEEDPTNIPLPEDNEAVEL